MGLFTHDKDKKNTNIAELALTDNDETLEGLKKSNPGAMRNSQEVLDLVNLWRDRILKIINFQVNTLDLTINTKSYAGDFQAGIDTASQKIISIATATEEMSQTAREIADSAQNAVKESKDTVSATKEGVNSLDNLSSRIDQVEIAVKAMGEAVNQFILRTQTISELTEKVKEIAAQTNLLSLNAAIEAARAGEHGRGFAVVADEVRNLAEKSAQAAKEIEQVTSDISSQSKQVETTVSDGLNHLSDSKIAMESALNVILSVAGSAAETDNQVSHIATAAEEQSQVTSEMASNLSELTVDMDNIQKTFNNIYSSFDNIMLDVKNSIQVFSEWKFDCMLLNIVKSDHLLWVTKAMEPLSRKTGSSLSGSELADHHECRLGKWYDTKGKEKYGDFEEFKELGRIHPLVHETGKAMVKAANSGKLEEANNLAIELKEYKDKVIIILDKLNIKVRENSIYNKLGKN